MANGSARWRQARNCLGVLALFLFGLAAFAFQWKSEPGVEWPRAYVDWPEIAQATSLFAFLATLIAFLITAVIYSIKKRFERRGAECEGRRKELEALRLSVEKKDFEISVLRRALGATSAERDGRE